MTPGILHLVDSLNIGGMERVLVTLANGLQQRGLSQTVCCLRRAGPLAQALSDNVRLVEMRSRARHYNLVPQLRALARECRPDLVHGQNLSTWCDVVRAFAGRYPIVQSFHGFLNPSLPFSRRVLARWLAAKTQCLLAVSHPLRLEMARRFKIPANRITVVPNGIDTAHFAPTARGPAEQRIRASVNHRFLCVTVASLTPAKSPHTLLHAARRLPENVAFIWVGAGPLEDDTRRRIIDAHLQPRFQLVGPHADVRPFLHAADLFVLPSKSEALPLSVLEAQATGLPVVATPVGALPDLVTHDRNGLLAPSAAPEHLADCISRLLEQPALRRRMGRLARRNVTTRFSIDRMIDHYLACYEATAGATAQAAEAR